MNFLNKKNNFMFLAMLVFVFVASSALVISGQVIVSNQLINQLTNKPVKIFPPLPVLASDLYFPTLSAQGVVATDLDSGVTLYEKNADSSEI